MHLTPGLGDQCQLGRLYLSIPMLYFTAGEVGRWTDTSALSPNPGATSQTHRLFTEGRCETENPENLDSKPIWTAHSANDFSKIHQDDVHTCGTVWHVAWKGEVPDQFLELDLAIDSRLTSSARHFSVSQIKELQSAVTRMPGCLPSGTIGYSSV